VDSKEWANNSRKEPISKNNHKTVKETNWNLGKREKEG